MVINLMYYQLNVCPAKHIIILLLLIIMPMISVSCGKGYRNAANDYFDVKYHSNDQGFANPADLARALPKYFDGYTANKEPFMNYAGENSGHIESSGVSVEYSGDKNLIKLMVLHRKKKVDPNNFERPWDKNHYVSIRGYTIYYIKGEKGYTYNLGIGNLQIVVYPASEIVLDKLISKIDFNDLAKFAEMD